MPVQADLSNLEAQLDWCFTNHKKSAATAKAGKVLAMQIVEEIDDDLFRAVVLYAQAWI